MAIVRNPILRHILFGVGCLNTLLGLIGVFLPLLPTTPFILVAAWCFLRSSPKAHAWLKSQPFLGPALEDWEKHRAISRKNKVIAGVVMALSLSIIWLQVEKFAVKVLVTFFLSAVSLFIFTRKEKK